MEEAGSGDESEQGAPEAGGADSEDMQDADDDE